MPQIPRAGPVSCVYSPRVHNHLHAPTYHLQKDVRIRNRVVDAIVLSSTDATNQEALVGPVQRAVVARARAPHHAAVQRCLKHLGSYHPKFDLKGSARSVVQFRGVLPEAPCVTYVPVDVDGKIGILWLTFPRRCMNSFVWLYTWSATSTLNMAMASGIPSVRKHVISGLSSDTVRPNAAHATSITPIIILRCSGDCETTTAPSV